MKKVSALVIMLIAVMTIQAQSLTKSVWIADTITDGIKFHYSMSFEDDGSCKMGMSMKDSDNSAGMNLTVKYNLTVPGTYTVQDNRIKMNLNEEAMALDFDIDIDDADPATKALISSIIKPEIERLKDDLAKELIDILPTSDSFKIVSLTDYTLVLYNESDDMTLTFSALIED